MFQTFRNAWKIPELKNRLLFTLAILVVYRLGCAIPVPFVTSSALTQMFSNGNMLTYLDMMSGGALSRCTLFALGVTPYINASIIVQLLTVAIPSLENIAKEPDGQQKLQQITRYAGGIIALIMSLGYYFVVRNMGALKYTSGAAGIFTAVVIIATFTAGAQLITWCGEQIDDNIVKQEEPFVDVHLYTPNEYVGSLMDLCQNKRGVLIDMKYMDDVRVDLHYALPLGEIVYDFFDAIKSRSRGYASYDYEFKEYRESDLVKLDFLLNGDPVDALSMIVFRDNAYAKGRRICEKLRDNIPRNLFEIPVQAAIGGKIIARETVKAMRKDVLAKCYGGDISRKKKLLEKQKEGKKKMRQLGSVSLPSEAFTAVLKLDSDDD